MNIQFDELMYRAGLTAQGCWDEMDEYDRTAILKFALLIVRECGQIAYSEENDYGNKIRFMILEHFGVE